jgi:hypothetical protein
VRFRIYEYTYRDHSLTQLVSVREITHHAADIQWHVHIANTKSFTQSPTGGMRLPAPNDPGEKTIGGVGQSTDVLGQVLGANVQLGSLQTDQDGRLRVLGGFGRSESPSGAPLLGLFSPGWFDDVSDGPVRATIKLRGSDLIPMVQSSWIIAGVSAFAQPIVGIVSLYDLAYDLAVAHFGLVPPSQVSFTRDIYPILKRPVLMQWIDPDARQGHGPGLGGDFLNPQKFALLQNNNPTPGSPPRAAREAVFTRLKNPNGGGGDMPRLNGLTVTKYQYERMRRWSLGDFVADWNGVPVPRPFDQLTPQEQTIALDEASLWKGVGGAFSPGIEAGMHFGDFNTFESAFRIRQTLPPGYLTSTLSVPWQSDYSACGWGWWPSGRPNSVTSNGMAFENWARFTAPDTMINAWWKLGFVVKKQLNGQVVYLETERV